MAIEENALERALRDAAANPAGRPDFYRVLLASDVYVIGATQQAAPGARTVAAGEELSIQNWSRDDGTPIIPFFTSLPALQRAITVQGSYLALPALSFFEITKGATLVLNPKSEYGKEFFPHEVQALLSGGVNRLPEQRVTQQETKVLLGQPAQYPAQMVDALTAFFATRSQVKAAYLTMMHDTAHDAKPHLVIGIHVEGDSEAVMREAGTVAGDTSPAGEAVDLFRVVPGDKGLSAYFIDTVKPFYARRWGAKLKSIFGVGRA